MTDSPLIHKLVKRGDACRPSANERQPSVRWCRRQLGPWGCDDIMGAVTTSMATSTCRL